MELSEKVVIFQKVDLRDSVRRDGPVRTVNLFRRVIAQLFHYMSVIHNSGMHIVAISRYGFCTVIEARARIGF